MPIATVRGVEINYQVLGERGPWVALQPGGRRGLVGVRSLAEKIAEAGCRVLVYDRRNCGASGGDGSSLPHRAFQRGDREQPGQSRAPDVAGAAALYRRHGGLAPCLQ